MWQKPCLCVLSDSPLIDRFLVRIEEKRVEKNTTFSCSASNFDQDSHYQGYVSALERLRIAFS